LFGLNKSFQNRVRGGRGHILSNNQFLKSSRCNPN